MIWVLIATTWVFVGSNVQVNVSTQTYPDKQQCEIARGKWQPAQPVTSWGAQCQEMPGPPNITIRTESKS